MINLTIQNTIQNTIRNTLGDAAFDMLDLFSGGQQGVWYDPSDLATMFQESTGGTAVTADGQPVGLMYDKSRGELFGDVELITNGTFDTDLSGWSVPAGSASTITYNSGAMDCVRTNEDVAEATLSSAIVAGKNYTITFEVTQTSNNSGWIYFRVVANYTPAGTHMSAGVYSHTFTATSGGDSLKLSAGGISGLQFTIDNISVREVLGTTATQPVATKRPTYKDTPDRLEIDLVDDALLFDIPTGGIDGYMVVGTNDGTASYGVSLPAGSYDIGGDYFMGGSVNGFLLREGSVSKSDLAKVEKDFVSKGAKASYGDVTDFNNYWREKNINEFPLIDTGSGAKFQGAWRNNSLTSFPLIDTSSGTSFDYAWGSNNLTEFPVIDTSNGITFQGAWEITNIETFPELDFSSATSFAYAWSKIYTLTNFPANMFDNCLCTNFLQAFRLTNLSQESIDNILISINSNGTSNGTFSQSGGSAPSAAGEAAIDAMRSRGWTITVTGGY